MADRYYRVGPKIWSDNPHWNDDQMLLAFYILTTHHRTTEGLFRLPLEYACADLKWPMRKLRPAFDQLVRDGFVEYDHEGGVLLIVKAMKWQTPTNPNQATGAVRAVEGLARTPLFNRFASLCAHYSERLTEQMSKRFPEAFPEALAKPQSSTSKAPPPSRESSTPEVGEARPPLAVIDGGAAHVENDLSIGGTG